MATYGKKKRSILPSFTSLRDFQESTVSKPKKETTKVRVSSSFLTMPSLGESKPYQPRDDSIEEMVSMLLEDTTMDQLKTNAELGRRLSQAAAAGIFNNFGSMNVSADKNLPQLPSLLFNGDDAWAMRSAPVVTAAGSANHMSFDGDNTPLSHPIQGSNHSRKGSAPSIPRKSSKRRSGRPKSHLNSLERKGTTVSRDALKTRISPPKPVELSIPKPFNGAIDINEKVQAMLAATKALKGDQPTGPGVSAKKRRFADSKVLTKVKSAINEHLAGRHARKKEPMREGRLLEGYPSGGQVIQQDVVLAPPLSTMEIRMNEGDNFKNPKIFTLTGHGNIPRKPLADDGKSLRSRRSEEDPFSEPPQLSGLSRILTSFETRLRDDMSIDKSRESIDLLGLTVEAEARGPSCVPQKRASGLTDFDAILSSSPVAHSTPRIRLEPTFGESGKKVLKNVPADSRSVFDFELDNVSDMELDEAPSRRVSKRSTTGTPIRKKSQAQRYSGVGIRGHGSKRMKKHPSPSKADLEFLEHALRDFPQVNLEEESACAVGALAPKDANIRLQNDWKRGSQRKESTLQEMNLGKSSESMPVISGRVKLQSENLDSIDNRRSTAHNILVNYNSMMDIDELQWDKTAYHIGMRAIV